MSVYLYSGTPGSGKSYETVLVALANLKRGKWVIANFAIRFTKKEIEKGIDRRFVYRKNEDLTIEYFLEFAIENKMIEKQKEHQCMVIIDEAGGRYNCRRSIERDTKEDMRQWVDFFSQHMKLGYDFILVAQMDRMLDRQIRGVVETEFKFRQINRFGPFQFLPFKVFVKVEYWYGIRQRVSCEFRLFRKAVANRYDRFKMFSGFTMSQEILEKIEALKRNEKHKSGKYMESSIQVIYTGEGAEDR